MTAAVARFGALACLAAACGETDASATRDEIAAEGTGGLSFVDVAAERGIDVVVQCGDPRRWFIVESNGSGAAWLDHDGDGDLDLFVANGGRLEYLPNQGGDGMRLEVVRDATARLYRNEDGGKRFVDVSEAAGAARDEWINASVAADVDGDGDTDLYLACFGRDVLLVNEGGRFVDGTEAAGLGCELWGAGAAFADADRDGDLDLYVSNYCVFDPERPPANGMLNTIDGVEVGWGPEEENKQGFNVGAPDVFYLNDGAGRFREATAACGLVLEKALCSYAAVFSDVDGDGRQDILVANDLQACNLFVNRGNDAEGRPRFEERGEELGFAFGGEGKPTGAMGLALGDVDADGDLDVFRTNFDLEACSLHLNRGGRFREAAHVFGLAEPSVDRLGWGAAFLDADLDGDLDLAVANGHVYPQAAEIGMSPWAQASQLFEAVRDEEGRPRYVDATARTGADLGAPRSARGLALADFDDDGDVDVLLTDIDERPRLLENRSARAGRWLGVALVGKGANTQAVGARVVVVVDGRVHAREMRTNDGLYSTHDPRMVFGLGGADAVDEVVVHWPTGGTTRVETPPLDAYLTIREADGSTGNGTGTSEESR